MSLYYYIIESIFIIYFVNIIIKVYLNEHQTILSLTISIKYKLSLRCSMVRCKSSEQQKR